MSTAETRRGIGLASVAWGVLALAGAVTWWSCMEGDAARAWRALLVSFLYFTSLSAGLVVWPAVVRGCNGNWHGPLERSGAAGVAFALPSLLALVLLWIGSPAWSPWYGTTLHQGLWLNNDFVFGRNLAALLLFWGMALRYLRLRRTARARGAGNVLVLIYTLTFSLLGFDLVMALDPRWDSTLAGGYFFISGLYIAITGWAFLAAWQPDATAQQRHDLGKLVVAFSLMTVYLMYSHLLPIWYENLPREVPFVVPRLNYLPMRYLSYLLVALVYFGPLVLLLTERSKRNRVSLGLISLLVLVGLWFERWWLVVPSFEVQIRIGPAELAAAAAGLGLFALGVDQFQRRVPQQYLRGDK